MRRVPWLTIPPLAHGHPGVRLEEAGEVHRRGEAEFGRNLSHGDARVGEERLGALDAQRDDVRLHGRAVHGLVARLERAHGTAQAGGESRDGRRLVAGLAQEVARPDGAGHAAVRVRGRHPLDDAPHAEGLRSAAGRAVHHRQQRLSRAVAGALEVRLDGGERRRRAFANPSFVVDADDVDLLGNGDSRGAADVEDAHGALVVGDEEAARLRQRPEPGGQGVELGLETGPPGRRPVNVRCKAATAQRRGEGVPPRGIPPRPCRGEARADVAEFRQAVPRQQCGGRLGNGRVVADERNRVSPQRRQVAGRADEREGAATPRRDEFPNASLESPDAGDDAVDSDVEAVGGIVVARMGAVDQQRHVRVAGKRLDHTGHDRLRGGVGEVAQKEDPPPGRGRRALFPCRGHGGVSGASPRYKPTTWMVLPAKSTSRVKSFSSQDLPASSFP